MKVHQTFTIDPEVAEALNEVADKNDLSKSKTVNDALLEYLRHNHPVIAQKYRKEDSDESA